MASMTTAADAATETQTRGEKRTMVARVGAEAPDFEANAFVAGKGLQTVKLSDYRGRWIVLCFYPGDFTFV
jgi:peroxiredoxin (alkyl hydroperoxide reductase subunit C)